MPYVVEPGASVVVKRNGLPVLCQSGEVIPDGAMKNAAAHLKAGFIRKVSDKQATVADRFAKTGIPQKVLSDVVPGVKIEDTLTRTKGGFINEHDDKPIVVDGSPRETKPRISELSLLNDQIKKDHPALGSFETIEEARAFLDESDKK